MLFHSQIVETIVVFRVDIVRMNPGINGTKTMTNTHNQEMKNMIIVTTSWQSHNTNVLFSSSDSSDIFFAEFLCHKQTKHICFISFVFVTAAYG